MVPPKLPRDIFINDRTRIERFLTLGLFFFVVVLGEMGDVFGMDEVFFAGVWM